MHIANFLSLISGSDGSGDEANKNLDDDDDDDDSAELLCTGCDATSKDDDPALTIKGKTERIRWARTSKRTVRGKKRKVKTGAWCQNCFNIWRSRWATAYPKLDAFKAEIISNPAFKKKVKANNQEYVRRRAGGQRRHALGDQLRGMHQLARAGTFVVVVVPRSFGFFE